MFTRIRSRTGRNLAQDRKGAATVEFAIIAPVLVIFLLGMIEVSRFCEMSTTLRTSLRQGARLAGMDRDGILGAGQATNEKIAADVRNFLSACGLPGESTVVSITNPTTGEPMDLDAPESEFELFTLTATIPYSTDGLHGVPKGMTRSYVFRNARGASIIQ
ncbi:MAG: TadE/TadG family type IV pilus assembly protein [Patescibacteria group bacterium]|nr:TadE/TadG family type IV pilus assembly protein [Patescibacteria group bacterium]